MAGAAAPPLPVRHVGRAAGATPSRSDAATGAQPVARPRRSSGTAGRRPAAARIGVRLARADSAALAKANVPHAGRTRALAGAGVLQTWLGTGRFATHVRGRSLLAALAAPRLRRGRTALLLGPALLNWWRAAALGRAQSRLWPGSLRRRPHRRRHRLRRRRLAGASRAHRRPPCPRSVPRQAREGTRNG